MHIEGMKDISEESMFLAIKKSVSGIEFKTFLVGISSDNLELKLNFRKSAEKFISKEFGAEQVSDNSEDLGIIINLERGLVEAKPSNLFIEGKYNKFSRKIAQTFHYCFKCKGKGCANCNNTGKLSEESVQELIEKIILPAFDSKESKFHGCGREDADVKMLGKGRPFVIELVAPLKRNLNLKKIENEINLANENKIAVSDLKLSTKKRVVEIKNTPFSKIYFAICISEEIISENEIYELQNQKFDIIQLTPVRVEKRRVMKERPKNAEILETNYIDKNTFSVKILASHGLYVKEFISGDEERTKPNISEFLKKKCFCKELDVLEIVL